jgi:hypothetical protein
MRYRKQDSDGDILFGNQQNDFDRDTPETVGHSVLTRLTLWVGEWFLDTDEGTPYEQAMLGTGKQESIEPAIRERILETEGVLGIEDFELIGDAQTRKIQINLTINTIYGDIPIKGVL